MIAAALSLTAGGALAAGADTAAAQQGAPEVLLAVMILLLPLGFILLLSSEINETEAPAAAIQAVISWLAALLGYFLMGFAFEFGGLAIINNAPDYSSLAMEWSPFSHSLGSLWGVIGLEGFALSGLEISPLLARLLITQAALVGCVAVIEAMVWQGKSGKSSVILRGLIIGGVCFPLVGNWIYGGGWLANLGKTQQFGHGFVDFAGGASVFLLAGVLGLGALIYGRQKLHRRPPAGTDEADNAFSAVTQEPKGNERRLPSAHLPVINLAGAALILMGMLGLSSGMQLSALTPLLEGRAVINFMLAAIGGGLASSLYSAFTTSEFNGWMLSRGLVAGILAVAAAAPFIPVGIALLCGALAGFLLPFVLNALENQLKQPSAASSGLIISLLSGVIGLIIAGLFADGKIGAGWNGIGLESYLGIDGQGVSGLWVLPAMNSDFPGQLVAQLAGGTAIILWGALFALLFFWLEWAGSIKPVIRVIETPATAGESQYPPEEPGKVEDEETLSK
jgi:ammonium transporter, Amt family